jgi:Acyl-CoA synthetases (AMP-forming)/AMP-acid ligases II
VFGLPDETFGELPAAVIVATDGTTAEDIESACEGLIARHKRPRRIRLVNEIPKSPAGKVLRTVLREKYADE